MTDEDYARKLDELDRLLNDPDVPMQAARIWSLLGELSHRDVQAGMMPPRGGAPASPRAGGVSGRS